jgi:hypothetical protein
VNPDDSEDRLRTAAARWSRAEESVMGTLRFDPAIYQTALGVMSRLLAHMRSTVTDLDALLAAEHDPRIVAIALDGPPSVVEPETVVAAALAIRHRELGYQAQLADRRTAIAEARASGEAWARVVEPAGPRSDLTIHVATGLAVIATTEVHLDTGELLFVARPVRVDLDTGAIAATDELGEERVARSREELDLRVGEIVAAAERWDPPGGSDTRRGPVL